MQIPARLFFAIVPPEPVREACEAAARDLALRMQPGSYRTRSDKYHITLHFLGDTLTPEEQMRAVQAGHLVRCPPFSLQLNMAGTFANRKPPIYLAPATPPEGLAVLRSEVVRHCKNVGIEADRYKFAPHLTIVREAFPKFPRTAIKPIPWDVSELYLLRSPAIPTQQGAVYEEVARWELRDAARPGEQASLL